MESPGTEEMLRIRVSGPPDGVRLIYLPGIHGDWHLVTPFRLQAESWARFVEFTYPRTLEWSLRDYAARILEGLARQGIDHGWLLAESFGSQVAWAICDLLKEGPQPPGFRLEGIILAGGFPEYPMKRAARWVASWRSWTPGRGSSGLAWIYAKVLRFRFGSNPVCRQAAFDFMARRTPLDMQAMLHRLRLLTANQPGPGISRVTQPVYYLSGFIDPIVPWFLVLRELRRVCPALRKARILLGGDHNVLGTAPVGSARQIRAWVRAQDGRGPKLS